MGCHCDEEGRLGELFDQSSNLADFVDRANRHGAGRQVRDGAAHRKLLSCECHMLREAETLTTNAWCYCTAGYTKNLFEHIFGCCPVEAELLQSIKTGHEYCVMTIKPQGAPRKEKKSRCTSCGRLCSQLHAM